jgi:eukaryotic-like serine/threonine-protein kinase
VSYSVRAASGQVHAAFDTALKREVAIKSLRPELLNDDSFVARFYAEATNLARLNHPNITTVHELVAQGRNLYMVMERVRGLTLDDLMKRRTSPLGIEDSVRFIGQAAEGLCYAHAKGVIHRDIKPANLMVAEGGLVKIMDFGIARARGSQRLTRDGSIVGTLAYMAPEQLRGEPGDERSDLYSLAIVLYEMLAGAVPFSAPTDYALMQAQIHQHPRRPSLSVPGMDKRVERALMQALAKKPEQRFASVTAFRDALGAPAARLDSSMASAGEDVTVGHGAFDSIANALSPLLNRLSVPVGMRILVVAGAAAACLLVLGVLAFMPSGLSSGVLPTPTHSTPSLRVSPADPGSRLSTILPAPRTAPAPPVVFPRQ